MSKIQQEHRLQQSEAYKLSRINRLTQSFFLSDSDLLTRSWQKGSE
ncbi:MAG: hypothetical protein KC430_09460 [Amylibacter sp.]|nr:hypothetical protein [Amylibacter sp.]